MTATAQEIINQAMRLIEELDKGETPNTSESNAALTRLNNIIENWSRQRLMIPNVLTTEVALVNGQQAYTVGPGGYFSIPRPYRITACSYRAG